MDTPSLENSYKVDQQSSTKNSDDELKNKEIPNENSKFIDINQSEKK